MIMEIGRQSLGTTFLLNKWLAAYCTYSLYLLCCWKTVSPRSVLPSYWKTNSSTILFDPPDTLTSFAYRSNDNLMDLNMRLRSEGIQNSI